MSGAIWGSGGGVGPDEKEGRLMPLHAPRNAASAEAIPRLTTLRALLDLIMASPRAKIVDRIRPAAKRKTPVGAMMSSQLRRRSDLVSDSILYRPHQGLKALLDRIGAKPYFRAHN
jgi:hypothetical protein